MFTTYLHVILSVSTEQDNSQTCLRTSPKHSTVGMGKGDPLVGMGKGDPLEVIKL